MVWSAALRKQPIASAGRIQSCLPLRVSVPWLLSSSLSSSGGSRRGVVSTEMSFLRRDFGIVCVCHWVSYGKMCWYNGLRREGGR